MDIPNHWLMTRRRFLGGAAATMAAYGCTSTKRTAATNTSGKRAPTTATTTAPPRAGDRPDPSKPEGTDTLPQIEHIVVVMMENHSFDNYFGMLGRGDGFTLDADGQPDQRQPRRRRQAPCGRSTWPTPASCRSSRARTGTRPTSQCDNGAMDGFVRSDSGPVAMGYWTGDDLPFYYGLARHVPALRPLVRLVPGRRPTRTAASCSPAPRRGNISTDLNTIAARSTPPNGTILDALDAHGIAWRNYYTDLPDDRAVLTRRCGRTRDKLVKIDQFFTDAAAGTLPAFCLVDPDFDRGVGGEPRRHHAWARRSRPRSSTP